MGSATAVLPILKDLAQRSAGGLSVEKTPFFFQCLSQTPELKTCMLVRKKSGVHPAIPLPFNRLSSASLLTHVLGLRRFVFLGIGSEQV